MHPPHGIPLVLTESGPLWLGTDAGAPSYRASRVRIEDRQFRATIIGGDSFNGIEADLGIGESVTDPGVGTFTLVDVTPRPFPHHPGDGGQIHVLFSPYPGFTIDPALDRSAT